MNLTLTKKYRIIQSLPAVVLILGLVLTFGNLNYKTHFESITNERKQSFNTFEERVESNVTVNSDGSNIANVGVGATFTMETRASLMHVSYYKSLLFLIGERLLEFSHTLVKRIYQLDFTRYILPFLVVVSVLGVLTKKLGFLQSRRDLNINSHSCLM